MSTLAQQGHAFDLGWALTVGAIAFDYRCEPEELRKRAKEGEDLGRENSLPLLYAVLAPVMYRLALIREGWAADGMQTLKVGVSLWEASGGKLYSPYCQSVLAEGMALLGDLDGALHLIDEQIAQVERPGWEERIHYAEILRLNRAHPCLVHRGLRHEGPEGSRSAARGTRILTRNLAHMPDGFVQSSPGEGAGRSSAAVIQSRPFAVWPMAVMLIR